MEENDNLDYECQEEFENSNNNYENHDFLLHRNLDVDLDYFCNEQVKELKKLPTNLRIAKELIYQFLLPHIDNVISDLEYIKQTSNYEEDIPVIPVNNTVENTSNSAITAINSFNNHNIKGKTDNKMIYGTATGDLAIIDLDLGRNAVFEKNVFNSRIEIIKTSTVKYFDTFISRIVVAARGNPIVNIYTFNHSYSSMILDESININSFVSSSTSGEKGGNSGNANQKNPQQQQNKSKQDSDDSPNLEVIPSNITISKDSFFMVISTFSSNNYIFKFNETPFIANIANNNFNINDNSIQNSNNQNQQVNNNNNSFNNQAKGNQNNNEPFFKLIGVVNYTIENDFKLVNVDSSLFNKTIEDKNNEKEKDKKNNNKDKDKKNIKDPKAKDKKNNKEEVIEYKDPLNLEELNEMDPLKYNIKNSVDEFGNDISSLQTRSNNFALVEFIQKKLITDDNEGGGFSSILITSGIYFSFYNTSAVKFFSLTEFFSKQMTNSFKISKAKLNQQMSEEDLFALKSKISKQEREFYAFIKKKIENSYLNNNAPQTQTINSSNIQNNSGAGGKDAKKNDNKDKNPVITNTNNNNSNTNPDFPKSFNFFIISRVSSMCYARKYNSNYNFIGIGLMNGSILIWDCELHSDKFYFETPSKNEITYLNINEANCFSGSTNGRVYIHSLSSGQLVYECINNSYCNHPLMSILPVYYNVGLTLDLSNRCCLYYMKDRHKIARLNFEVNNHSYSIENLYGPLVEFNKDYIIVILKDEIKHEKTSIIDMINFQTKLKIPIIKKYEDVNWLNKQVEFNREKYYDIKTKELEKVNIEMAKDPNYSNMDENSIQSIIPKTLVKHNLDYVYYNHHIGKNETGKSTIAVIKIKDIFLKSYPNIRIPIKNGTSIKKIMDDHTLRNLPTFEMKEKQGSKPFIFNEMDNKISSTGNLFHINNANNNNDPKGYGMGSDRKQSREYHKHFDSVDAQTLMQDLSPNRNMPKLNQKKLSENQYMNNLGVIDSTNNLNSIKFKNNVNGYLDKGKSNQKVIRFGSVHSLKEKEENNKFEIENLKKGLKIKKKESFTKNFAIGNNDFYSNPFNSNVKMNTDVTMKGGVIENNTLSANPSEENMRNKYLSGVGGGGGDKNQKDVEKNSEKKNIFYLSYKSIKERFSYKEQRINKIQMRNERIQKQLKLPIINNKK